MEHALLRSWLDLPPGPWPPDHYTLLGLPPGRCDPATVEPLVLARMERLRPHQLLHPELATEGMNRLAQALICLTDPVARAGYDAELGVAAPDAPPQAHPASDFLLVHRDLGADEGRPPAYELVEPEEPEPLPPAYELVPYEVVEDQPVGPLEAPYEVIDGVPVPSPGGREPPDRQQSIARLATIREFLAAWRKLRPILGDPSEPADNPERVLAFIGVAEEVRSLQGLHGRLVGGSGRPGALVMALLRQPLLLATLRSLLPGQRRAVARDWRRALWALEEEAGRLHELAHAGRATESRQPVWVRVVHWVASNPAVVVVVALIAVAVVGFFGLRRRP